MTAKCTKCGKTWQVSIKANLKNYICPHCTQKKSPSAATDQGSKKKLE